MDLIWENFLALDLDSETRQVAEQLKDFLSKSDLAGAAILSGRSEQTCKPDLIRALERSVHETLGKGSDIRFGKLLRAFVEYANRKGGYDMPLPAVPILLEPEPSVFEAFPPLEAERADGWRLSLNGWVETSSVNDMESRLGIGALLVSAALNGGLVGSGILLKLFESIDQKLTIMGGRGYLDLELPWRGSEGLERRRWFPDPVSELIFLQLKVESEVASKHRMTPAKALWPFIRFWFKRCGNVPEPPRNFSEFIKASKALSCQELPVSIGSFMARDHVGHSLRPEAWQRLHGVYPVAPAFEDKSGQSRDQGAQTTADAAQKDLETFEWGAGLWSALKATERDGAAQKLRGLLDSGHLEVSPAERLLSAWALHLCTKPASSGKRLALSTIYQYVRQTGPRLIGLAGESDITCYEIEEFEELYTEVIADAQNTGFRNKLGAGLREFHHFLHLHYGVPRLAEIMDLGGGSILHPVDANLITLDEYQEIRGRIRTADLELMAEDLPTIVELILVLGFRCGLRRMEALMLRIQDVHLLGREEIIVRRYKGHRLKTDNGKRKLPIYALFDADELKLLTDWVHHRKLQEQATPRSDALFAIPEKGWLPIDQDRVIPVLHRVMREVTGDNSLRYHHLRHSFASWTFLRLSLAHHGKHGTLLPHHPMTEAWLHQSYQFHQRLLSGRHRPHLFAVARLLGHAGPDMSLEHYIHTMDLAALAIDERRLRLADKTVAAASGIPVSSAYRLMNKAGVEGLLERVRADYPERVVHLYPNEKPCSLDEPAEGTLRWRLDSVQRFLKFRQRTSIDRSILTSRFGLSEEEGRLVEDQVAYLASLRSNNRRIHSSRHRFRNIHEEHSGAEFDSMELHTEPRTQTSREIYLALTERVERLLEEDEDAVWEVVDYYIHNQWKTWGALIFRDPEEPAMAKRYLVFLEALGFRRSELQFFCCDPQTRSASLARWKRALGLTFRDTIKRRDPTNKQSKAVANWLFIAPNLGNDGEDHDDRLFGYRYLMVMLATAMPILRLNAAFGAATG